MQKQREKLLKAGYLIPMTADESRTWEQDYDYPEAQNYNPTWLAKDRKNASTHPHFKGPFTRYNVKWYHIYCPLETLKIFTSVKSTLNNHEIISLCPDSILNRYDSDSRCFELVLPIIQRKTICVFHIFSEIFEDQQPRYTQNYNYL